MVNFNGSLLTEEQFFLKKENRGLVYGDILFETLRVFNGNLIFWEEHYFRLMASMRILRMEIPMTYTPEYLETEILKMLEAANLISEPTLVEVAVYREGANQLHEAGEGVFFMSAKKMEKGLYQLNTPPYGLTLYKDAFISNDILSTLNSNNRQVHTVAELFAIENGFEDSILLNSQKEVVSTVKGNIFLVQSKQIQTPPLTSGCKNGILRKKIIELAGSMPEYEIAERPISPYELQKADEVFLTDISFGIRSVTHYRKAKFGKQTALLIIDKLNALARLV